MIYFTTLVFTLILSHIARATPACGDVAPPEELHDLTYADAQSAQHALPFVYDVTWSSKYSQPYGWMNQVTCGRGPMPDHRPFRSIPNFPSIGGAFNILNWTTECFSCWKLTNTKNQFWVFITAIDHASTGYNVSKEAFDALGGVGTTLLAEVQRVKIEDCGYKNFSKYTN